jgi:GH25 family lysozyme M1 (1,4-beta-N-acetylmuramidase)
MPNLTGILSSLASQFEDPVGLVRPLWRDYSRYQVIVNFDIAKANGVLGMAARAGISWGYIDPFFSTNYKGAGNVGIYRTSYHVLWPDQPVLKQADESWYKAHPARDVIPRVIDLEKDRNQPWSKIADQTWAMSSMAPVLDRRNAKRPFLVVSSIFLVWLSGTCRAANAT